MDKNKEELLIHFEYSIDFVRKLGEVSEEIWRSPIAKGKWSVAEVVGHLSPWDEFVLNDRLPYLFNNSPLPKGPEEEELNHQSAEKSRNNSKEETILNFINIRRNLIIAVNNIDDELWSKELKLGNHTITLYEYIKGFMEHDLHHFEQINKVIGAQSHL